MADRVVLSWREGERQIVLAPGDRRWVNHGEGLRRLAWLGSPYPELAWQAQAAATMTPHAWRRLVVWVGPEPELLGMGARQAIAYPLQLRGLPPAEIDRRTDFWAERLGVPPAVWGAAPLTLSREQQKQIAWVRALAIEPPVLLGDRPRLHLGPETGERLVQVLRNLPQTIVLIYDEPTFWPGWLSLPMDTPTDDF